MLAKTKKNKIFASISKNADSESKKFWKITSYLDKDGEKVAELLLYGVVSEDNGWGDVTAKEFAAELKEVENSKEISVRINSPGGDVFAGQAIYSMLKRSKANVVVYVDGIAASIASLIAMAGDKVVMPKNSMMMIHKPWCFTAGNANDMREQAETLDKVEESMLSAYVDKTGLDVEEIKSLLAAETWLTASEAVSKGFADEIEETEVKALVAKDVLEINGQKFNLKDFKNFNASWFKNKELGAKVLDDPATEKPKSKKEVVIKNKMKGKQNMNLKQRCMALGLDYDKLAENMEESQISAMVESLEASKKSESDAAKAEKERVNALIRLGEEYNATSKAIEFVKDNKSVDAFKDELLKSQTEEKPVSKSFGVGISVEDAQSFSISNLVNALANPQDREAQTRAKKEFDMCQAAADKYGVKNKGIVIPVEALLTPKANLDTTAGAGLIPTTLKTDSFIDMLRNKSVIMQVARKLNGLVGNIDIPKQSAGATGSWVGEDVAASQTNATFDTLQLRMKTVSANTYVTRNMLKQTTQDIEALLRNDLALALALAIDKAAFYGTGSANQPKGISKISGVNTVNFAGTNPTFTELVQMETEIGKDNADVADMAYIINAATRGLCKTTQKFPGQTDGGGVIWEADGKINGYKALVTNQINDGEVFLGNFADFIVGMFGGLEIIVDPYTYSNKGGVQITTFQDVDFGARHAESFCLGKHTA